MEVARAYKVLGLYPGASKDEVKRAYRDLAQVWHPDRFEHNERLAQKAQRNLKRINEAFALLKDHEPTPEELSSSRLNQTFSAVRDLGDMLATRIPGMGASPRRRPGQPHVVLGLGEIERTGVVRRRRKKRSRAWIFWLVAAVVIVAGITMLL